MTTTSTAPTSTRGGIWRPHEIGIIGTGHYFPREQIVNAGAAEHSSAIEDRILGGGGVRTHHRAGPGEGVNEMATWAARAALADAGVVPAEVDLLVMSNWTDRWCAPERGAQVATELGCTDVLAFDINYGCAGFVHGVHMAAAYLSSPAHYRTAVVVSAEQFLKRVRPGSKGEQVVGDGAGAVVLRRGREPGLLDSVLNSDGSLSHMTTVTPDRGWVRSDPSLNEVAVDYTIQAARTLLDRNGLRAEDIDWLIPHSATEPFQHAFQERVGVPRDRILTNLAHRGNVSSASIPTTLSEARERGQVSAGDLVLSVSLSGAFSFGGLLYLV